jgi:hypothetical protein
MTIDKHFKVIQKLFLITHHSLFIPLSSRALKEGSWEAEKLGTWEVGKLGSRFSLRE